MSRTDYVEILLVEDNADEAELAVLALKESAVVNHVHTVSDGVGALEFLFCEGAYAHRSIHEPPKVVLLDMKLPKLDGLEVLARLRADPRTRLLPVVLLTSSQEQSDVLKGYNLGANAYIVKPIDFQQFRTVIKQLGLFWVVLNQAPMEWGNRT